MSLKRFSSDLTHDLNSRAAHQPIIEETRKFLCAGGQSQVASKRIFSTPSTMRFGLSNGPETVYRAI